ncbi:MAG: pilus assembly protein PilM, partial [Planctomycetes bacterium]|nr:pilus assembly protein PilM [Planctomycetota bacterium]
MSVKKEDFIVLDYGYIELDAELKKKSSYLDVVREALEDLAAQKNFKGTEVCISISAKSVNSRFLSLDGGLSSKEVKEEIASEAERQIPFPLEEVEWDSVLMPDRNDEMQVAIFAVRREHIQELLGIADDVGFQVRGVQVSGVALYSFVSAVMGVDEHTVILDIGEKTTNLIVVYDGGFWLRSLPLSGHHITELLEKKFRITTKEASALKHEMEKSPQKDKLFRVIEPKLKELITEVKRSINFRKTQVKGLDPKKILSCGGSSQLSGVSEYFSKELKLAQFNMNLDALDFSMCEKSDVLKENIVSYGVAMGMAIQGLGETEVSLNLIPKKYVAAKILKSKRLAALIVNVALLMLVVMAYISGTSVNEKLDEAKGSVTSYRNELTKKINGFNGRKAQLKPLEEKSKYMYEVMKRDQLVPRLYAEVVAIVNAIPDVYLTEVNFGALSSEEYMGQEVNLEESARNPVRGRGRSSSAIRNSSSLKAGQLYLKYVGNTAQDNLKFYEKLMAHPLFAVAEGESKPKAEGRPKQYEMSYSSMVALGQEDRFQDSPEVQALREKKNWVFKAEGEEKKKLYSMDE